jgi:hypothetical protein
LLALGLECQKNMKEKKMGGKEDETSILSDAYLVVGRLALADLVLVRGPEARAVWSEDLVDEHDLAGLVEAELELGVGDDDAALFGVLSGLQEISNQCCSGKETGDNR